MRIWLNHWFSTAFYIIQLIREGENFTIAGSSQNEQSVMQNACDEWYREPALQGSAYVDFCIDFCREKKIDIFLPRREMTSISKEKARFEKLGIKVMAEDYEIMRLLGQKDQAYAFFREKGIGNVPDYKVVTNVDQFQAACGELSKKHDKICFKFVVDEGGMSYHLIDDSPKGFESLYYRHGSHISYREAVDALSEREEFPPLMVMPYLEGNEVSVDCLKTGRGLIMLPRVKGDTRVEMLQFHEDILSVCRKFYEYIDLKHPCNIQFRYQKNIPYFLEVNTRMSGGIQMTCLAGNVNIPNIAVNQMMGIEKEWTVKKEDRYISYVECPMLLSKVM